MVLSILVNGESTLLEKIAKGEEHSVSQKDTPLPRELILVKTDICLMVKQLTF